MTLRNYPIKYNQQHMGEYILSPLKLKDFTFNISNSPPKNLPSHNRTIDWRIRTKQQIVNINHEPQEPLSRRLYHMLKFKAWEKEKKAEQNQNACIRSIDSNYASDNKNLKIATDVFRPKVKSRQQRRLHQQMFNSMKINQLEPSQFLSKRWKNQSNRNVKNLTLLVTNKMIDITEGSMMESQSSIIPKTAISRRTKKLNRFTRKAQGGLSQSIDKINQLQY